MITKVNHTLQINVLLKINSNMEKLTLNPNQKKSFEDALQLAYKAGEQNATFLANSMYQLVRPPSELLDEIIKNHIN